MADEAKRRKGEREARTSSSRVEIVTKDKSKTSWRSDPDKYRDRKLAGVKKTEAETGDIEWPEDWR